MKQFVFVIIVLTLVLSGCAASIQTLAAALPPVSSSPCGDGICSGPKNAQNWRQIVLRLRREQVLRYFFQQMQDLQQRGSPGFP